MTRGIAAILKQPPSASILVTVSVTNVNTHTPLVCTCLPSEANEMGQATVLEAVAELERRRRDCRAGGRRYMGSVVAVWRSSSGGGVTMLEHTDR